MTAPGHPLAKRAATAALAAPREHEVEAAPGLPEPLPSSERLLWQGGPDWRRLAIEAFHVRKIAIYFAAILLARGGFVLADGGALTKALVAMLWLTPLVAFALGTLVALAWLSARSTVYTITSRRVVMRIGIVLTVTFNLPFAHIAAAGLRRVRDGHGDIPLQLNAEDRIAWLHLWPHVRPWKLARPQPMLRGLADAQRVAAILSTAWSAARGIAPAAAVQVPLPPVTARPAPVTATLAAAQ